MTLLQLATVLLACIFILTCTGVADHTCMRLRVKRGHLAAWSILMLFLSALPIRIGDGALNPAAILLLLTSAMLCRGTPDILLSLLLALLAGIGGWLLVRLFPNAAEPGALLAALPALLAWTILPRRRMALLACAAAPLFSGLGALMEDAILYGFCVPEIGAGTQLDAQITGLFLLSVLWYIPVRPGGAKQSLPTLKKLS